MFPALVVLIVNKQRSIVDTFNLSVSVGGTDVERQPQITEHRPATVDHLSFAVGPPTCSTTDIELPKSSHIPKGTDDDDAISDEAPVSRW